MAESYPNDYRQRHPIAIEEANRSVVIFVGQARGGLSAAQRADVIGLAQIWLREGTGAITADVPVDTRMRALPRTRSGNSRRCWLPPACRRAGSLPAAISRKIRVRWRRSG